MLCRELLGTGKLQVESQNELTSNYAESKLFLSASDYPPNWIVIALFASIAGRQLQGIRGY